MGEGEVAAALRDALLVVLKLGGPPLAVVLVVGLVVSLLQAVTQVNEASLAFVPKVLALCVTLALTGSSMLASLGDYARRLFDMVVAVGGS